MIVRPNSGAPVVPAAGLDRVVIEAIDGDTIVCREGNVGAGLRCSAPADPEEGFWTHAIACKLGTLGIQAGDAERTQGRIVESLGPLDIADADGHVVQHVGLRSSALLGL